MSCMYLSFFMANSGYRLVVAGPRQHIKYVFYLHSQMAQEKNKKNNNDNNTYSHIVIALGNMCLSITVVLCML